MEVIRSCSSGELELLWFGSDSFWEHYSDKPSSRTEWEEGVLKELHQRITNAAGDEDLDQHEAKEGSEFGAFRFDDEDLFFFSEAATTLVRLTTQAGLAPEEAKAVRRAVAAMKRLPELTPEINVQIEVAHRESRLA